MSYRLHVATATAFCVVEFVGLGIIWSGFSWDFCCAYVPTNRGMVIGCPGYGGNARAVGIVAFSPSSSILEGGTMSCDVIVRVLQTVTIMITSPPASLLPMLTAVFPFLSLGLRISMSVRRPWKYAVNTSSTLCEGCCWHASDRDGYVSRHMHGCGGEFPLCPACSS